MGGLADLRAQALVEFPLTESEGEAFLREQHRRGLAEVFVKAGQPERQVAVIQGYFGWGSMALSTAGRAVDQTGLLEAARRLQSVAVQLAPSLGLAYLGLEPDLSQQLAAFPWAEDGTSMHLVRDMLDVVLFDVYPFQIIGPGHIERLGGVPNGAQSLTGGRFAVSCGKLPEWLPDSPSRRVARARALDALAPCLVRGPELTELRRRRWG